jgi:hypothetical protein
MARTERLEERDCLVARAGGVGCAPDEPEQTRLGAQGIALCNGIAELASQLARRTT